MIRQSSRKSNATKQNDDTNSSCMRVSGNVNFIRAYNINIYANTAH